MISARFVAVLAAVLALLVPAAAGADTLTVNTTADSGGGSLRGRIGAAGAGDIVVLPASTSHYMVTAGEIPIDRDITIRGAGAGSSIIDAGNASRIFHVSNAVPANATVRLEKVTLTKGNSPDGSGPGGAILVESGSLVVADSALTHNTVEATGSASNGGGAIYNRGLDTTLLRSSVTDNSVTVPGTSLCCSGGGGIYSNGTGRVLVESSSHVDRNSVDVTGAAVDGSACCQGGGGIYQDADAGVTVSDSTVSANHVTVHGADCCHGGGALYVNPGGNVPVQVMRSTMDSNTVAVTGPPADAFQHCCSGGGAVFARSQTTISASTLTRNSATVTAGGFGHGGGAVNVRPVTGLNPTLGIGTTTLARNTASVTGSGCCNGGGAVQFNGSDGPMAIVAALIAGNRSNITGSTLSGGGGVYEDAEADSGYVNTTISGNSTNAQNPNQGGGGIYMLNAGPRHTTLANVTLAGNSAPLGSGGAVLNDSDKLRAGNSLFAFNSAANGSNCRGIATNGGPQPVFTSLGHNLMSGTAECGLASTAVAPGAVRLGPLAANGGPTLTRALLPGSPAIDGGDPEGCTTSAGAPLTVDQRRVPRPLDGDGDLAPVCDIGAYEAPVKRAHCTLRPKSRKVGRTKKARFRLTARCDEAIRVGVSGKARIQRRKKKARTVKLRAVHVTLKRGVARTVRLRVPGSVRRALASRARISASFVLAGKNADGAARATARIKRVARAKH